MWVVVQKQIYSQRRLSVSFELYFLLSPLPRFSPQTNMPIENRWQWFRDFLLLPSTGMVPGKCPRTLYPKSLCRDRLGPSNDLGAYPWREYFNPPYQAYIGELFERAHQRKLREDECLPYHFARGVLAEYDGLAVDWAKYAVSIRRKGCANGAMKILSKYRKPRRPIEWLNPRPLQGSPSSGPSSTVLICFGLYVIVAEIAYCPIMM